MAVHNGGPYLRESIESILAQSFTDFEFVVVDDGSTDDSRATIDAVADPRLRSINSRHAGLTAALNLGLAACRGALIARMDADDVADPDRLAAQVAHLDGHRDVHIVCADAALIDAAGRVVGAHRMGPMWPRGLLDDLLFRSGGKPIIHPTVTLRRAVLESLGGYRDFPCAEDHDLWLRACPRFRFAAIPRPLLRYRIHDAGLSRVARTTQAASAVTSAACHIVRMREGIDLFDSRRDVFEDLLAEALRAVADRAPVETAFQAARATLRRAGPVQGGAALAVAFCRHGFEILPRRRRKACARLASALAARATAQLVSPAESIAFGPGLPSGIGDRSAVLK
jgi:glycosyltransferase involved in cell wall biosynthesis